MFELISHPILIASLRTPMSELPNGSSQDLKKQKRKRLKRSQPREHAVVVSDVRINRTNKKLKFDDLDSRQEDEQIPVQQKETEDQRRNRIDSENPKMAFPYSKKPEMSDGSDVHEDFTAERNKSRANGSTQTAKPKRTKISKRSMNVKQTVYESENDDDDDDDYGSSQFKLGATTSRAQLQEQAQKLLEARQSLPVFVHKDKIIDYVTRCQVTVIIGETGSGKSTQIPQFLMPLNKRRIAVTQPRRVAAASLAARVSNEYGCILGQEVGFQVRFSNVTSPKTKINYLTDGMLIRELMLDHFLSKYSTIVIDEAHERTVLTDLVLGFLKQIIVSKRRNDLKVVVMSATLNAELFSKFFHDAPILFVEGRIYPVSRHYLSTSSEDIVDTMIRAVVHVNMSEQEGDILCFLPGQEEIDNCVNILNTLAPDLPRQAPFVVALPLYAALSPGKQLKIFEKLLGRKRKVILATNIAETSITVSGVKYVIDSGLRKVKVWKHQLGLSTLLTTPISQASAKQRAGRAGRECAGKVFRLYSEKLFLTKLPKQQESEILRNDVILPILTLKRMGVHDLLNWTWLEHPGKDNIISALGNLHTLGALNDQGKVTSLGYKLAVMPLPPALSAVLIEGFSRGVIQEIIDIVSCLSVENLILNVSGNGELRDEVNFKRRQYCALANTQGDLVALKEYFDHFKKMYDSGNIAELKMWCRELFFSYKGFKNVLKVKYQLGEYLLATIKQDNSILDQERASQVKKFQVQMSRNVNSEEDDGFQELLHLLNIEQILKSFLKGYASNIAIGMPDRSFRTCSTGQLISIHPSSNLFGKTNIDAMMYIEYVYTTKAYGRNCSRIKLAWLQEIAPSILGGFKENINE